MFNFMKKFNPFSSTKLEQQPPPQQPQYYPNPQPNPYSVHMPIERDPRTLGLDIQEEIEKIKATWRGMRLSDDGKDWVPIKGAIKMINETGAETLLGLHSQMMSIPHATTNMDDRAIYMVCRVYGNNLNEQVCSMYHDWEIPKSFFDSIIDPLVNSLYMFLLKSKHDKQRMWDNNKQMGQTPINNLPPLQI